MKKEFPDKDFESTEQEILSLLQKIQGDTAVSGDIDTHDDANDLFADDEKTFEDATPELSFSDVPLIFDIDQIDTPETITARRRERKVNAHAARTVAAQQLVSAPVEKAAPKEKKQSAFVRGLIPYKGDSVGEIVRKSIFLISLLIFIGSLIFLSYFMVIEPQQVESDNLYYAELYNDKEGNEKNKDPYNYPAGMQPNFRQLYDVNKDVAGWLTYVSSDKETFLDIDLPVVLCDNNDKYLNHGFDGSKSRSGTLFFDSSNVINPEVSNKVNIIYGHNMNSGAMFAGLNKLVGNVYHARSAPYINLNTLYENQQYMVFAVIVCDEDAEQGRQFGYLRNSFADDVDFINYVNELRARSMFDYPIDVNKDDELLILSTCTNQHQVKLKNGRLAVIARRVRADEKQLMDTTKISKNEDVIMPYAWYTAQDRTPHVFYTQADYHIPEDSVVQTTTTATTGTSASATATTGSGTAATSTTASKGGITSTTVPGTTSANTTITSTTRLNGSTTIQSTVGSSDHSSSNTVSETGSNATTTGTEGSATETENSSTTETTSSTGV